MIALDSIQRAVIVEGLEDYVGLWQVARRVREVIGETTTDLVREASLKRLGPLLVGGYIEAGFSPYVKGDFEPWGIPGHAAMERIDVEWRALGKDPNIWEICWFKNTEQGNALAQTLRE
jgi:hypothetical protein